MSKSSSKLFLLTSHTILIAPGGKVVFRHHGAISEEKLLETVLKELSTVYQPKPNK